MPALRRIALLFAVGLLGLSVTGGLAAQSRADTSVTGIWFGGHRVQISGSLEKGFTVIAAESWMIVGCPIPQGTRLSSYTPNGNGTYTANYLWTEASTTQGQEGVKCENSYRTESGITASGDKKKLAISGCGYAFCATLTKIASAPTTKPKDTKPPVVRAFDEGFTKRRTVSGLAYSVKDDSGRATTHLTLYEGGVKITARQRQNEKATGHRSSWPIPMAADLRGPMYFCVWAQDAAGNHSKDAPMSDCGWISLIARVNDVSNGCGGAQWGPFWENVQNFFLNSQTYGDFKASFRDACNAHDAGYGGFTITDPITDRPTGFRTWTRSRVDDKFRADIQRLCSHYIRGNTQKARVARDACKFGPHLSLSVPFTDTAGATAYYEGVRAYAKEAFDADLMAPGTQDFGSVTAHLQRGARKND